MGLIDRYLVGQYLRIFLMTFISLLGIYVIADFVTNFSDFARLDSDRSMASSILTYYGARVPLFFEMCGRIVAVLAAVVVVSSLQERNELTALMAAGMSRWRVVQPLILVAMVTACLGVVNRELILPSFRDALSQDIKDVVHNNPVGLVARFDDETDILFDGESLVLTESTITEPRLTLPIYWPGVGQKIRGETAVRQVATETTPAGFLLEGVSADTTNLATAFEYGGRELIWSHAQLNDLRPGQMFVCSSLKLEDLREGGGSGQYSTTAELLASLRTGKLKYASDSQVALHARFVQPVLDLTLLFLGLPLALALDHRHVFKAAGKCIGMVMLFAAVVLFFRGMGIQNIVRPSLAAWGPVLTLVPLAAAMSNPLRR